MGQIEVRSRMDKPPLYQEGRRGRKQHSSLHTVPHHYYM